MHVGCSMVIEHKPGVSHRLDSYWKKNESLPSSPGFNMRGSLVSSMHGQSVVPI